MFCTRHTWKKLATGLLALTPVLMHAQQASTPAGEAELIAVLKSDAAIFQKAKACQRLAVVGTREAVPVLAELLADEELAHYARFGLEPIPDPSVDEALREAMGKLRGKLLIGVINSIGVRKDSKALSSLAKRMDDDDPEVAAAAAAAVGRLGSPQAAKVLREAVADAKKARRASVADACFPCAEALVRAGQRDEAAALFDAVRQAEVPPHIQIAATRGAILARQAAGVPLLLEKLESGGMWFAMALGVAREMPQTELTRALVEHLDSLPPERRALVVQALGDRGDAAARPAVLQAAKRGPPAVRVAAIEALGKLGGAAAVPVLLEAAAAANEDVAQTAQTTLAELGGADVDRAIVASLSSAQASLRPMLIELVGDRRIRSAVPELRKAAETSDDATRRAAVKALGQTIELEDLPVLTSRLLESKSAEETAAVQAALKVACARMPDRDACAEKLVEPMAEASFKGKCLLLEVFSSVGGPKALGVVSANAKDANDEVRDVASRVLSEWKSQDAAHELLSLTKGFESGKDRMRTLRSFSELVRRLGFPKEERIGVCRDAMELARNDEERKVVLYALAGIPAPETLDLLSSYLADPDRKELKESICSTAVTISERLIRTKKGAVAKSMKVVLKATEDDELAKRARKLLEQAGG